MAKLKSKALNDTFLRAYQLPTDEDGNKAKLVNLFDGEGLDIQFRLRADGSETGTWRFTYKRPSTGLRTTLNLGIYPTVSLADARVMAQTMRTAVALGTDPLDHRIQLRKTHERIRDDKERIANGLPARNSFLDWMKRYHAYRSQPGRAGEHGSWGEKSGQEWLDRMQRHAVPYIGHIQVTDLTIDHIIDVTSRLEKANKLPTAQKVHGACVKILAYAISCQSESGLKRNVAMDAKPLVAIPINKSQPKLKRPIELGRLYSKLQAHLNDDKLYGVAALLQVMLWQRPGMIRAMQFAHIDFDHPHGPQWIIPAQKMKLRQAFKSNSDFDHVVPLPAEAVRLLKSIWHINHGRCDYVFGSSKKKPMARSTLDMRMRWAGFDATTLTWHGLRGTAQTMCHDFLDIDRETTECNLAHVPPGLGRTYNNARYVSKRQDMLEKWVAFLDEQAHKYRAQQIKAAPAPMPMAA